VASSNGGKMPVMQWFPPPRGGACSANQRKLAKSDHASFTVQTKTPQQEQNKSVMKVVLSLLPSLCSRHSSVCLSVSKQIWFSTKTQNGHCPMSEQHFIMCVRFLWAEAAEISQQCTALKATGLLSCLQMKITSFRMKLK